MLYSTGTALSVGKMFEVIELFTTEFRLTKTPQGAYQLTRLSFCFTTMFSTISPCSIPNCGVCDIVASFKKGAANTHEKHQ